MSTASAPPVIFAPQRRLAVRRRMLASRRLPDAPRYLLDEMIDDMLERLSFLRHHPARALVIGDATGRLASGLGCEHCAVDSVEPAGGFDEEHPFGDRRYDFIASLGTLDTVNDLPGALVHIRNALMPGGLMIASFPGAGSVPRLRAAMLAADADRPAPRLHPMIDVRAGGQLLQRAGFADPVADSRSLDVGFRSLGSLLADLRAQGLSNVLDARGPTLGKAAYARAQAAFAAAAQKGRTTERFEILTLTGWRR